MSSVSVQANSTTDDNLFLGYTETGVISSKPTTESKEIRQSSKDVCLNSRPSSSKQVPSSSNISSCSAPNQQPNGGLNENTKSDLLPRINSTFDDTSDQNDNQLLIEGSSQAADSKEICRFFERNGFCRYGRNCRYYHPISAKTKSPKTKLSVKQTENAEQTQSASKENPRTVRNVNKNAEKGVPICKFFSRRGFCLYGKSCRFVHQKPQAEETREETEPQTTLNASVEENIDNTAQVEAEISPDVNSKDANKSNRVCKFYLRYGDCRFGVSCKFKHLRPKETIKDGSIDEIDQKEILATEDEGLEEISVSYNTQSSVESQSSNLEDRTPTTLRNKKKSDMTSEDFLKLRKTEINQLKRRYPKAVETALPDIGKLFEVQFFPTDPDWPFDVKSVTMNIMIPDSYPEENLQVDLLNPDEMLPDKLIRYFNKTTFNWLQESHESNHINDEVKLIFRPFLKWLDKSLEDIFIAGLKMVKREMEAVAAGIEFITHEELNANNKVKGANEAPISEDYNDLVEDPPSAYYEDPASEYIEDVSHESVLMNTVVDWRCTTETPKRGTEIKLRNLELLEGAASLTCCKLSITVQCGRCKMRCDVVAHPHRSHRIECERCKHKQKLTFRPQMLHQFSSVAGYLDLDSCQAVDVPLLTCEFAVQCLPCGRQNFISGMQYGQYHTTWCMFCHSKLSVKAESVKMNQLQPNVETSESKTGQVLKLEKKEKKVKDPAIQEGKPLPENGTCKHYKKSFRWLRFPCCGKAYPCDHCHDEKESEHDMKYATRMICGFCAKEQPYSKDRPCTSCASNMTKKTGTHWEGGKGCRDKIKMSKDDKQKYAGTNKTVPKKSQPAPKKDK